MMNDDPALVLAAVRAVVQTTRTADPLPPCPDIVTGTDGVCP